MVKRANPGVAFAAALAACTLFGPACEAEAVGCGPFAQEQLPTPVQSPYPSARERANSINQAVKSTRYSILFFGDSLTEGWDPTVWEQKLGVPRRALNAGVSGDRTDNLLWRLQNGNLAGPPPKVVVLLIGTNDLAYHRSPELTAEGIRAALQVLRPALPGHEHSAARPVAAGRSRERSAPPRRQRRSTT